MKNNLKEYKAKDLFEYEEHILTRGSTFYRKDEVDELLKQFDKPVVPQYVADWFEEKKDHIECSIYKQAVDDFEGEKDRKQHFNKWFAYDKNEPIETLIKMKLFGYEVEKEKQWIVKATSNLLFVKWDETQPIFVIDDVGSLKEAQHFNNKVAAKNVANTIGGYVEEVEDE